MFSLGVAAVPMPDNHTPCKGTPGAKKHWTLCCETITVLQCSQINDIKAKYKEGIPWSYLLTKSVKPLLLYLD